MRQDKDRSAKWLLTHHGDSILRLGGFDGFTSWRALQPESVAPRRLPDGLMEVQFPGDAEPTLVLVEIESYPDAAADQQVLDDLMLIALDRRMVPEVVTLVLKPKGNLNVLGTAERRSRRGTATVAGAWPVVRLWELDADELLATNDPGVVPWVPLARSTASPEDLLARCRNRLAAVPDPKDRAGLTVVAQILAGLAFPGRKLPHLLGESDMLIESPVLDEFMEFVNERFGPQIEARVKAKVEAEIRADVEAKVRREYIQGVLEARFGPVGLESQDRLAAITDNQRLKSLGYFAATCPDLASFEALL